MPGGDGVVALETAYIGLGSNIGDKLANLRSAVRLIRESARCSVRRVSSLYASAPVGVLDQPEFLNAVIEIETDMRPHELLRFCMDVEGNLGRVRTIRWGPRVIDLDILIYGNMKVSTHDLQIPHPGLLERAFVVSPLAEIAADLELGDGLTASAALARVADQAVRIVQEETWAD